MSVNRINLPVVSPCWNLFNQDDGFGNLLKIEIGSGQFWSSRHFFEQICESIKIKDIIK